MPNENPTEQIDVQSGGQDGAVDQPKNYNEIYNNNDKFSKPDDSQDGVVDHQNPDDEEPDAGESGAEDAQSGGADRKDGKQSHEDNAVARQARLRALHEADLKLKEEKQKMERELDERIASMGLKDPYTGKSFASVKELEAYNKRLKEAELKEQAKKTGKTVEQLSEEEEDRNYIRRKRQEEVLAEQEKKNAAKQREFVENDLYDFMEKYPDVDIEALDNNQKFRKFCGKRYGVEPLAELYKDYVDLMGGAREEAEAINRSKADRSTGTGTPGGAQMTSAQRSALEAWNRENPEMKMTAKEFLSRVN